MSKKFNVIQTQYFRRKSKEEESNVRCVRRQNRWVGMTVLFFIAAFGFTFNACEAYAELRNNMPADIVLGQPNFTSSTSDQGGNPSPSTNDSPQHLFSDGKRLIMADRDNRRVLIYEPIPTSSHAEAQVVVGQPNFETTSAGTSASKINNPQGIAMTDGKLFVGDSGNNRVLIWNQIPTEIGAPADVVIGQTTFAGSAANQGGTPNANTLSGIQNVNAHGNYLLIADSTNHRIVIFNRIPTSNNASADVVLGQPNFTSSTASAGRTGLNSPRGVFFDGQKLFIGDFTNNRVLIFNSLPTVNGTPADLVLGQDDFSSTAANRGGGTRSDTMSGPRSVYSDGTKLFVADSNNSRILVFNKIPTRNGTPADFVIGQPDFNSGARDQGGTPQAFTIDRARGVFGDGRRLFVADHSNNRTLIYNLETSGLENLGPQFSQGKAVVGKVFLDWNGDGVQQAS